MGSGSQPPKPGDLPRHLDLSVEADEATPILDIRTLGRPAVGPRDRPCLTVLTGAEAGRTLPLEKAVVVLGRGFEADYQFDVPGLSRVHAKIWRLPGGQYEIEDAGSRNGTFVDDERITRRPLEDGDRIDLAGGVLLRFGIQDALEQTVQQQVYESAVRDPLTQVYNRRQLMDRLRAELSFAARHGTCVSLLLIDIDHFKAINDTFGHVAGDAVLRVLASHLTRLLRAEDLVARYGGEEFALLVRGIDRPNCLIVGERVRRSVAALRIPWAEQSIELTVSVGVAFVPPGSKAVAPEHLIQRADEQLYAAKNGGRNRVCGQ